MSTPSTESVAPAASARVFSRSFSISMLPAWLWAPCALYAISAGCILIGISKIIIPLYDEVDLARQMERFYCLIALNIYEIALISVALLILLKGRVFDDAIALTLLIAIFLIASSVALDTIAPDFPEASLLFGSAGLLASGAKLFLIDRFITGRLSRCLIIALVLLLAVNFLLPSLLAYMTAGGTSYLDIATPWRLGWYAALLAGLVLVIAAMIIPTGGDGGSDIGLPFLRTTAMHWIIASILFIGTAAHLYALTWAFNVPVSLAELAPAVAILCLILLELLRGHGYRLMLLDSFIGLAPLTIGIITTLHLHDPRALPITPGSPSDPAVWFTCFAAAMALHAWRREQPGLLHLTSLYLVAAVLLLGIDTSQTVMQRLSELNWNLAGFTLGITLASLAALQQRATLALASAAALAISIATCPLAIALVQSHHVSRLTLGLMSFSALALIVYGFFRRSVPGWFTFAAALTLAAGVLQLFFPEIAPHMRGKPVPALNYPVLSGCILLAYIGLISIWTKDWRLLLPGALPITLATFSADEGQGWVWVGLSFIVLALGAVASLRKGSRQEIVGRENLEVRDVGIAKQ